MHGLEFFIARSVKSGGRRRLSQRTVSRTRRACGALRNRDSLQQASALRSNEFIDAGRLVSNKQSQLQAFFRIITFTKLKACNVMAKEQNRSVHFSLQNEAGIDDSMGREEQHEALAAMCGRNVTWYLESPD